MALSSSESDGRPGRRLAGVGSSLNRRRAGRARSAAIRASIRLEARGTIWATGRPRSVIVTDFPAAASATTAEAFCFKARIPTSDMFYIVAHRFCLLSGRPLTWAGVGSRWHQSGLHAVATDTDRPDLRDAGRFRRPDISRDRASNPAPSARQYPFRAVINYRRAVAGGLVVILVDMFIGSFLYVNPGKTACACPYLSRMSSSTTARLRTARSPV